MAKPNATALGEKLIMAARECGMEPSKLLELVVASVSDPDARAGLSAAVNPATLSARKHAVGKVPVRPAPAPSAKKLAAEIEATARRLDTIGKALASKPKAQPVGKPVQLDPRVAALGASLRATGRFKNDNELASAVARVLVKAEEIERSNRRGRK